MDANLRTWALPRVKRILPLDDDSLIETLNYTVSLSKAEGAEHLKGLLGDSPAALEFISSFNNRRSDVINETQAVAVGSDDHVPRARKQAAKKARAPLHAVGPVRQPEGYGDVAGGYQKDRLPDALQVPRTTLGGASPSSSRDASPLPARNPPSASGPLISDFMPNVRSKQAKKQQHHPQSGSSTPRSGTATITTSNIADLTSAIATLELATNPKLSAKRTFCDCNATIHPLFETAPNCLNCGKIICAKEGLQPCSFCDAPILTKAQGDAMIRLLKDERGAVRTAQHNAGVAQASSGRSTPRLGTATPLSGHESADEKEAKAYAYRDTILGYQSEGKARTTIRDEAADYDATPSAKTTQWLSPGERAAALRRQQQYKREQDEANKPEWEKKQTVMSIRKDPRTGKLVSTYEKVDAPRQFQAEDADIDPYDPKAAQPDQHLGNQGDAVSGAFSQNPLLQEGKLIRPIWKPSPDEAKGKSRANGSDETSRWERKAVWRRVQDDYEDNEEWILDGGLRGYGTESRLMHDGSQQECG